MKCPAAEPTWTHVTTHMLEQALHREEAYSSNMIQPDDESPQADDAAERVEQGQGSGNYIKREHHFYFKALNRMRRGCTEAAKAFVAVHRQELAARLRHDDDGADAFPAVGEGDALETPLHHHLDAALSVCTSAAIAMRANINDGEIHEKMYAVGMHLSCLGLRLTQEAAQRALLERQLAETTAELAAVRERAAAEVVAAVERVGLERLGLERLPEIMALVAQQLSTA